MNQLSATVGTPPPPFSSHNRVDERWWYADTSRIIGASFGSTQVLAMNQREKDLRAGSSQTPVYLITRVNVIISHGTPGLIKELLRPILYLYGIPAS